MKRFFEKVTDTIGYLCFGDDFGYVTGALLGLALSAVVIALSFSA